ncbi:MAG: hypothetical protein WBM04_10290, partial [Candidatus Korobacteraceae bacterium]
AEHRGLLLLISTHATYITYLPVERRVPFEVPSTFSAASEAVPFQNRFTLSKPSYEIASSRARIQPLPLRNCAYSGDAAQQPSNLNSKVRLGLRQSRRAAECADSIFMARLEPR